jgi:hypothetical protein
MQQETTLILNLLGPDLPNRPHLLLVEVLLSNFSVADACSFFQNLPLSVWGDLYLSWKPTRKLVLFFSSLPEREIEAASNCFRFI